MLTALPISGVAADDGAEPIQLEFHAPSDCPGATSFLAQVRARAGKVRAAIAGETARTFTVKIVEKGSKVKGQLTLEVPPEPPSVREVTGETCSEIVAALALITALAIDPPGAATPQTSLPLPEHASPLPVAPPERASSPVEPVEPVEPAASHPIAPPPSPPTWPRLSAAPLPPPRWMLYFGLDFTGIGAVAPSIVPGVAWFFYAERKGPSIVSPALRASILRADSGLLAVAQVHAQVQWMVGRFEGCPLRFSLRASVDIGPCALIDGGAIEALGWGRVTQGAAARPWVAPGLLGRIQWDILGAVRLEAEGGATAPLVRDTFYLMPSIDVHQAPIVGGFGAAGISMHFF